MDSDGEIARAARLMPIAAIGEKLGIPADSLIPYGHTKAKIAGGFLKQLKTRPDGDLVLVTAMNPTPAGEGKTTTTVGLGDALTRLGAHAGERERRGERKNPASWTRAGGAQMVTPTGIEPLFSP